MAGAAGAVIGSATGGALTQGGSKLASKALKPAGALAASGIVAAGGATAAAVAAGGAVVAGAAMYGAYKVSEANTAPKGVGDFLGRGVDHVLDFFGSDAADQRLQAVDDFRDNQLQDQQGIPNDKISGPSASSQSTRGGQGGNKSNIENVDIVVNVMEDKIEAEIKVDGETYQGANQGFPR